MFAFVKGHREGICALCQRPRELRLSHIIPRYLVQWRTGKPRSFRLRSYFEARDPEVSHLTTPYGRLQQDGPKLFLLCDDCENIFSRWENAFKKKGFKSIVKFPERQLVYGPWLYFFLTSICWRVIAYVHRTGASIPHWDETFESWREILLNENGEGLGEVHLLPIHEDNRTDSSVGDLPPNWYDFLRTDITMSLSQAEVPVPLMIVKVGQIIIVALSKRNPDPGEWNACRVRPAGGVLGGCDTPIPWGVYTMLRGMAARRQEHDDEVARRKAQ